MKYVIVLLISYHMEVTLETRYPNAKACGDALLVTATEYDRKCVAVSPVPPKSPIKQRSGK